MSDTVLCPRCSYEIEVTEALSAQLRLQLQQEFDAKLRERESAIALRENAVAAAQNEMEKARAEFGDRVAAEVAKERVLLSAEALKKAREQVALELTDKDAQLAELNEQLQAARDAELAIRKERRELKEQKEGMQLAHARQLDEERGRIRDAAKKEAAEEYQLRGAEKDKLIGDLRTQIEELRRKSEQGSQQAQGEVLELNLEDVLRRAFPFDGIDPVPKGVHGGDVLQAVKDGSVSVCGTILWESKRTKNWSESWLPKLRDDQREAKAHVAILVSEELPKNMCNFGCVDGVWITSRGCAVALASALRAGIVELAGARRALAGQQGKMEILYNYLSSTQFKQRVEGIVEAFITMRADLEAEKRGMTKAWARREKQLDRAVMQTSSMYGDLSGIIGASLPVIENLGLLAFGVDCASEDRLQE